MRVDWGWLTDRDPVPDKLYWDHMPRLMELDSAIPENDPHLPVLHCALYAHTYAIWSAEGVTNLEAPGTVLSIGNDIAEVDESYLRSCLEAAVQVSPTPDETASWRNELIARMEREQSKSPDDVIGPRLRRDQFEVPDLQPG